MFLFSGKDQHIKTAKFAVAPNIEVNAKRFVVLDISMCGLKGTQAVWHHLPNTS
jgi:hypothetical protein